MTTKQMIVGELRVESDERLSETLCASTINSPTINPSWHHGSLGIRWALAIGRSAFLLLLAAGCATSPPTTMHRAGRSFPVDAFITQRAVLTAQGRQFPLNGYLSLSQKDGMRLMVAGNFGSVLADVLVKPDGVVRVMRSSPLFRPVWIQRYLAADLQCVFGKTPEVDCPGKTLSPTHFLIERRWYTLDLQIVEIKPGVQPPEMFDESRKEEP